MITKSLDMTRQLKYSKLCKDSKFNFFKNFIWIRFSTSSMNDYII